MFDNDTITAIATAFGNAGIHIIRISGPLSFSIINNIFCLGKRKKQFDCSIVSSHTIHYGYIVDEGNVLDEVMVSIMKAPLTYTKEDVVEINCHGSSVIVKQIISCLLEKGARLAKPGEFTKRAFLNGRIDMSQAEAVMDLIQSQNEYSKKSSLNQVNGMLKNTINDIRSKILHDIAYIEAALDDPEHYEICQYTKTLIDNTKKEQQLIDRLIGSYNQGKILKEGINTVIVGKPNARKSSLMNHLLMENRAIVTDIPGTTRDIIEQSVQVGTLTLNLIDTAGIHDTDDVIEKIGIEKTIQSIENAQLVLFLIDNSTNITEEDLLIYNSIKHLPHIILLNKCDINSQIDDKVNTFKGETVILYSTKDNIGKDLLNNALEEMFHTNQIDIENEIYITNTRHNELLVKAANSSKQVRKELEVNQSEDLITIDLLDAYESLGEIIGETLDEDVIDKIFKEFCMGK